MPKIKNVSRAIVLVLSLLFVLGGCNMMWQQLAGDNEALVRLTIGVPSTSRSISVETFEVTSVRVDFLENMQPPVPVEDEVVLESITWDALTSPNTYMIPLTVAGEYIVRVTHISEENGQIVEATESDEFEIRPMVITRISIIPGQIGQVIIEPGEAPEPVNLTGPWTLTWNLQNGSVVEPLYTTMVQNGNTVDFDFGASGTLAGHDLIVDNSFVPDLFSYLNWDAVVNPTEDVVQGPFSLLDVVDGTPITHPDYPEWGPFAGDMTLVRTDPGLFGDLSMHGGVDWESYNYDAEPPELIDSGTEFLDFDTSDAMADFSVSDEGPWSDLNIFVRKAGIDIFLYMSFDPDLSVGTYMIDSGPTSGPNASFSLRYLIDDSGFEDSQITMVGECTITYWDGSRVVGTVTKDGEIDPIITFDMPIAPPSPW